MDLADVGEVDSDSTELIVTHDELSAITADYSAFRMFFANQSADTLVSVFIDGADLQTVHDNRAVTLSFEDLTGIVQFDDLFTWTIGKTQLFVEEYHHDTGLYYANDFAFYYLDFIYECNGMTVSHPTAQPYPVPSAPISKLQALFTQSTAIVTWNKPKNLDFIGKGAWRRWTYDVEIHNLETGNITVESSSTNTSHLSVELDPSSMYGIRVRSLSPGGVGAWSKPAFIGKTLQQADIHPQILAAKQNDIVQLSIDGTQEDLLLSAEDEITDMDWNDDNVYWATQEGKVQFVNMSDVEHNVQTVSDISAAEAIVVDWFTGMLYWADKTQILRATVQEDGMRSISETVQAIPASDLAIDSVEAFLYWTTSSSVECSRLNGDGRFIYDELDAFTGEEVVGLTLDFDESKLRWFIHSSTGLKVFQADLAYVSLDPATTVEQTYFINSFTRQPALHYYSERLFWLNVDHNIVVSTIGSDSHATMMSSTPISALSIMQPSLHPVPDKYEGIPVVTPNTIEAESIQVVGVWDNFQIQWSPSDEVTYGTVWYEYLLKYDDTQLLQILTEPYHNVTGIPPYTEMEITLEAYTYWATSESTTVSLRSPMSGM
ncbi:proto-oncogene tyrosine-protein kinase ROS-like [Ptychodera flava]|uniref:proto-oncogene tyrosine-protein kinase ROS-like n=1 Tax=Ptychodera flava TaxID=63121 RepID=UPI00396A6FDB